MKKTMSVVFVLFGLIVLTACGGSDAITQQQVTRRAEIAQRAYYEPQNDMEFSNYNRRQIIADDPTTILWCTFFPPVIGQDPFTVPIVGKLTSGGKRPFPTEQQYDGSTQGRYEPELIQPDGMYGSSGDYRYGFTPADIYVDFTDMPSFCSTEPTVWQRNETRMVIQIDEEFLALHEQAREALRQGNTDLAMELLGQLEGGR